MSCGPGSRYIVVTVVVFIVVYYDDEYILMSIYIYMRQNQSIISNCLQDVSATIGLHQTKTVMYALYAIDEGLHG